MIEIQSFLLKKINPRTQIDSSNTKFNFKSFWKLYFREKSSFWHPAESTNTNRIWREYEYEEDAERICILFVFSLISFVSKIMFLSKNKKKIKTKFPDSSMSSFVVFIVIFVSNLLCYFVSALRVSRAVTRLTVYRAPNILMISNRKN